MKLLQRLLLVSLISQSVLVVYLLMKGRNSQRPVPSFICCCDNQPDLHQHQPTAANSAEIQQRSYPMTTSAGKNNTGQTDKNTIGISELKGFDCVSAINNLTFNPLLSTPPSKPKRLSAMDIIQLTSDCQSFRRAHGYERYPTVTPEELGFPLAFNILFYKEVDQLHYLLRAIYRPHNTYCLHVDRKSGREVYEATSRLAACFPNVFLASRREDIVYAGFSRLQADLNCMRDHLERPVVSRITAANDDKTSGQRQQTVPWRYLINLPSQEFPLKSNLEIVQTIKSYNGSNNIEFQTRVYDYIRARFAFNHTVVMNKKTGLLKVMRTNRKTSPPPFNLTIAKGSAYNVFSRDFVKFVLSDQRVRKLMEWMKWTYSPDEIFWATLQYNAQLHAPGGFTGKATKETRFPPATWVTWGSMPKTLCRSQKIVRYVCIFGVKDLPHLVQHQHLFANKFYLDFQPETLHCLDVWLMNKTHTAAGETP